MDEMLNILTKGIGSELGRPIRISYYDKKRAVDKVLQSDRIPENKKNIVYDILALTVFHDKIIIPLHGSLNFMQTTKRYGITEVSMSTYSIGHEYNETSDKCVKHFFAILSSFDIDIGLLNFTNSSEFIKMISEHIEKWQKK